MKKFYFFMSLLTWTFAVAGCQEDKDDPEFTVSGSNITNAPPEGTTAAFAIKANVNWNFSSDRSWITADPESGKTSGTVTVTVGPNTITDERTGTFRFSAEGFGDVEFTVSQNPADNPPKYTLHVKGSDITNAPKEGFEGTYEVESNADWSFSSGSDWITAAPSSGNGNGKVTVKVAENQTNNPREGEFTFSSEQADVTVTFKVSQLTEDVYLFEVSGSDIVDAPEEGIAEIYTIESNTNWSFSSDFEWITASPISGSGNGEVTVAVSSNETGGLRTGTFTFTCEKADVETTFNVSQIGEEKIFEVTGEDINARAQTTTEIYTITSNSNWSFTSDFPWITAEPSSGSEDAEVTVTIESNNTDSDRTGSFTFISTEADVSKSFNVNQRKREPLDDLLGTWKSSGNIFWSIGGGRYEPIEFDMEITLIEDNKVRIENLLGWGNGDHAGKDTFFGIIDMASLTITIPAEQEIIPTISPYPGQEDWRSYLFCYQSHIMTRNIGVGFDDVSIEHIEGNYSIDFSVCGYKHTIHNWTFVAVYQSPESWSTIYTLGFCLADTVWTKPIGN